LNLRAFATNSTGFAWSVRRSADGSGADHMKQSRGGASMRAKGLRRGLVTMSAFVLGLAVAASSWAQGMYYKEIKKDDRFYVFNDAKRAEAFEKGGDMGTAITRVGAGPNGETVVADTETALELFFFK